MKKQDNHQEFNFILTKCNENYLQCKSMKTGITHETSHWISFYGCSFDDYYGYSFDIFAKDIPITEQEIVLQKKKVLITSECHKIFKNRQLKNVSAPCHQEQL